MADALNRNGYRLRRVVKAKPKKNIEFTDYIGKPIRLLYYPPYHSKYNLVERCWGILEKHWNGAKLIDAETMLEWAKSMTWKGINPNHPGSWTTLIDSIRHIDSINNSLGEFCGFVGYAYAPDTHYRSLPCPTSAFVIWFVYLRKSLPVDAMELPSRHCFIRDVAVTQIIYVMNGRRRPLPVGSYEFRKIRKMCFLQ
jgi:hypothetical protein